MAKHIHIHINGGKTKDAGWDESKHKRNHGQFSSTGGSGAAAPAAPAKKAESGGLSERQQQLREIGSPRYVGLREKNPAKEFLEQKNAKPEPPKSSTVWHQGKLYMRGQEPGAARPTPKPVTPAPSPVVPGKGGLYLRGHEPSSNAPNPASHSAALTSAAKSASRAAERSVQGGSGDPHELHMKASAAHAEAAKAAQTTGNRVDAQMHSDKAIMHKRQAEMHKPAASTAAPAQAEKPNPKHPHIVGEVPSKAPMIKGPVQSGQHVELKPEHQDDGDDVIKWVASGNEEKGRVTLVASNSSMKIKPTYVVHRDMLANVS
jgi:hypothetical protein